MNAFAQVAKNLGESVSRSFDFVGNMDLDAQQTAAKQMVAFLRDDGSEVKDRILGDFAKMSLASTERGQKALVGELTPEERSQFATELESKMPVFQAIRELKDLAKNRIDPIKLVAKEDSALGVAEQGAYAVAGSTGYMLATALPTVGPVLGFMAYQTDEYNRLLVENPDMNNDTAWALSSVEAAGNALIDKMQIDRFPVLAGLARHAKENGWRKTLATGGKIWLEQSAQELTQNAIAPVLETIAASMSSDMTPKNAGEEFASYVKDIPATLAATAYFALIGAGIASIADVKNPSQDIDSALKFWGFSEEQAARIKSATTPKEFDSIVREEMPKRTEANIVAGHELANDAASKAEDDQKAPNKPTWESFTKADGTPVFRVTSPTDSLRNTRPRTPPASPTTRRIGIQREAM